MANNDLLETVQQAEEILDLCRHAGWQDILKPHLEKRIERWKSLLPRLVLKQHAPGLEGMPVEEVAGRIEAGTFLIDLVESYLKRGAAAFQELNAESKIIR